MCGIAVAAGRPEAGLEVARMVARMPHRGPDAEGTWLDGPAGIALGHTRLSIIDRSAQGNQPMVSADGRFVIVFNGEVYNHVELRHDLADYPFRSRTDTEVVLAAWARWGEACLERLLGMFAFAIWDAKERRLVAVRDRFGIKPLYTARGPGGGLLLASEIKALHAAGIPALPSETTWATYLATGQSDHSEHTFWRGVEALPPGCLLTWRAGEEPRIHRWYDLVAAIGPELDPRPEAEVQDEYLALMIQHVRYRFRSDVPVGICLSGGLDSALLLGVVRSVLPDTEQLRAYTFTTGDPSYDELPWVEQTLASTGYQLRECRLQAAEVPDLAAAMMRAADEPYGGIPTLAYAKLFHTARADGVVVLLDGQGLDEQWAGYDYYLPDRARDPASLVQGTRTAAVMPACLAPEFARRAAPLQPPTPFPDGLRNLQIRDILCTKLPRALRFNDRASMMASVELREPFLNHRMFELALRQPADRLIRDGQGKYLLRQIARSLIPEGARLAPKRPVQTPQREWLRGPLRAWADALIETALARHPDWLEPTSVRRAWREFTEGHGDNSFWVWQWITLGLMASPGTART